jgi:hypothetical protein
VHADKYRYIWLALLLAVVGVFCFQGKAPQQEVIAECKDKEATIQATDLSGMCNGDMESGYTCNFLSTQILYRICGRTFQSNPTTIVLSTLQLHIISLLKNYRAVVLPKLCFAQFNSSRCPSCKYYVFALRKIII